MKKMLVILAVFMLLSGCAAPIVKPDNALEPTTAITGEPDPTIVNAPSTPEPKVVSACNVAGLTVSIDAIHLTKDSDGNDIIALECLFTNDNAEAVSFDSGVVMVTAFQDGTELGYDQISLECNYDWSAAEKQIKDGATITVFKPIPLRNTTSDVEVNVTLYSIDGNQYADATRTFEITK